METTIIKQAVSELQTSKTSPAQSWQVAKPDAQAGNSPLSVFRALPAATNQQVMPYILRLAVNFPAMNTAYQAPQGGQITFWTVLAEQVVALGWSAERTRYAVEQILRNCPYREFRVAEFLNIDRQVHEITCAEFSAIERSRAPHKPIVSVQIDGKWRLLYQEDAERIGLTDYQRRYTTYEASQMTPAERKQCGINWY